MNAVGDSQLIATHYSCVARAARMLLRQRKREKVAQLPIRGRLLSANRDALNETRILIDAYLDGSVLAREFFLRGRKRAPPFDFSLPVPSGVIFNLEECIGAIV